MLKATRFAATGPADPTVDLVRAFNRRYTRQMGLLDRGLLGSKFTLTEARVLYELARPYDRTATEISRELGIDRGYLSRLLTKFQRRRLIKRTRSSSDGRRSLLHMTPKGRAVFAPLDRAAREQISAMLEPMTPAQRSDLTAALDRMLRVLGTTAASPDRGTYLVRPPRIGDIGWVTHRQGILYAQEYGWDASYEALVAQILGDFVKNFDAASECGWIAERDGQIAGSAFVIRAGSGLAKLRLLYVEPGARGLGIGQRLVHECIAFARAKGYEKLTLWTNDVLVSARRIYQAAGFRLTKEEPHRSFGKDLVGQTWDLNLTQPRVQGPN